MPSRCAVLLLVATGTTPWAAATAAGERSLAQLAEVYRTGDRELAAATVALRSRESVEGEVERLATLLSKAGLAGSTQRLAVVALLTESALLDLRSGAFTRVRWELESAARLLETGPAATRGSDFERRFYLLAGLALHCGGALEPGHALLARALELARHDPELLTAKGAIIETVAALRRYDPSPDSDRRTPRPGGYSSESGGGGSLPNARLADAEAHYESALAFDPKLHEARLRLARVRMLRGRTSEALRDLERLAAEARRPEQRHLARLFAGRALERLGDVGGAAAQYRAATALEPQAQAALLALGRALDRLGDTTGAQEALDRAGAAAAADDPWLDYQSGQRPRLQDLLEQLRRLVP